MTAWCRRPIPQLAAVTGAMLVLNSWGGVPPVHSQTDRSGPPTIHPIVPPVPTSEAGPMTAPTPDTGRGPSSSWWYSLSMETRQQLQMSLRDRGLYFGSIDGLFGPQTQQAIRDYQILIDTRPTGELTAGEQALLLQQQQQQQQQLSQPTPAPTPGCAGPQPRTG
jgi:Putative peptidoglycan binding domain